jgi:phosphatidylserine/phosphatidylglycerophosphate/cardiolipin synthase-like enzyme
MKKLLPSIGIVDAAEPATYLLTPFQDGQKAYLAFLGQAEKKIRMMIYGFTLSAIVDDLIAAKQKGLDIKIIFDHTQAMGKAEKPEIEKLVAGGLLDGEDFLIGTSPEHHQINHLKATWIDDAHVLHGSWNYSMSASLQYNSIEVVTAPELAAMFDQVLDYAWDWIKKNEEQYQVFHS